MKVVVSFLAMSMNLACFAQNSSRVELKINGENQLLLLLRESLDKKYLEFNVDREAELVNYSNIAPTKFSLFDEFGEPMRDESGNEIFVTDSSSTFLVSYRFKDVNCANTSIQFLVDGIVVKSAAFSYQLISETDRKEENIFALETESFSAHICEATQDLENPIVLLSSIQYIGENGKRVLVNLGNIALELVK